MNKISWHDVQELAAIVCGLPEDAEDDVVEQALCDEFEISLETFHRLIEALAPMTPASVSPLTGTPYSGFAKDGVFIVKLEVEDD